MRHPLFVLTLVGHCLLAAPGWAGDRERAQAEQLFAEAQELRERGDDAAACAKFARSLELDWALGTMLYLADCHERSGRLATAYRMFRDGAARATRAGDHTRARLATEAADALEPRLPRLELVVTDRQRPGLSIVLDGHAVPATQWNVPIPVDPGEHEVLVRASGTAAAEQRVRVVEGELRRVELSLPPPPVRPAPSASTAREEDSEPAVLGGLPAAAIGFGALAVASAAVGVGLVVHARNVYDESLPSCTADNVCQPDGLASRNEAFDFASGADAAFTVAGVSAVVSLAFVIATVLDDDPPDTGWQLRPLPNGIGVGARW